MGVLNEPADQSEHAQSRRLLAILRPDLVRVSRRRDHAIGRLVPFARNLLIILLTPPPASIRSRYRRQASDA